MSHVLVLDDDPVTLQLCRNTLAPRGHKTVVTSDPGEASQVLDQGGVDLLLLDLSIPEYSGHDFLQYLRDSHHFQMPVLIITGSNAQEDVEKCTRLGVKGYLMKPFSHETLLQRVESLLAKQREAEEAEKFY